MTKPVLATPDLNKKFRVEANASNYTTGEVLSMKYSNNMWRPVAFISKSLSNIEHNYKIYNKEILVLLQSLDDLGTTRGECLGRTRWSSPLD